MDMQFLYCTFTNQSYILFLYLLYSMRINKSFLNIAELILNKYYNNSYRTRKHNEIYYFENILKLLYSCPYWSRYNGTISGLYLNKKHNEYTKKGIYDEIFDTILNIYHNTKKYETYRHILTDTCFIPNKYGYGLKRNACYKWKKGLKISVITDAHGIPLSITANNANIHDSKIYLDTYANMKINTHADKYKHSNRHKQYFLADIGYDSNKIKKLMSKDGYTCIIPQNIRNTKNKNKIRKINKHHKQIYKKRITVENYFSWIKQYPKLTSVYETTVTNFLSIVQIVSAYILFKRKCV